MTAITINESDLNPAVADVGVMLGLLTETGTSPNIIYTLDTSWFSNPWTEGISTAHLKPTWDSVTVSLKTKWRWEMHGDDDQL